MKIPNPRLLLIGAIACISITAFAQTTYVRLNIDQPNVEECITNIENTFKRGDFRIFPNPSQGVFSLEIDILSGRKQLDLAVYDISGKEILKEELRITAGFKKTLDLSRFGEGTYILNIFGGSKAVFKAKLIIY